MGQDRHIDVGRGIILGNDRPLVLLAGVNVIEGEDLLFGVAERLAEWTGRRGMPLVFKASFDKANRSSISSFRGPGLDEGLALLRGVKERVQVPVVTDIHEPWQAAPVAEVADIVQIPAFLARQTDLLAAACATGRPVLIKKMQMMSPAEALRVLDKCRELGGRDVIICERGTLFGYHNLVVDPLAFPLLKEKGDPVVFDVTHALQQPGALGHATGGRGHLTVPLAMAGVSQGLAGLFFETHPDPARALCDGPCALPLAAVPDFLDRIAALDRLVKGAGVR